MSTEQMGTYEKIYFALWELGQRSVSYTHLKVVGKDMVFYKLTDFARLEPGYFGIPEPVSGEIVNRCV